MAGEWKAAQLGNLVSHQKGFAFKSADYQPTGYPIVRVSNFTDRSVDMAECSFIKPESASQYEAYKLRYQDAVIATVGSWPTNPASVVGKTICVPQKADGALLNQNAVRLRANGNLDQRFLFHLLKHPDFQAYIVSTAQGSASQASITLNDIFRFEFVQPPLSEQRAIAHILGTLDDKIELNRRMNETLEGMARAIFKSWFVDFDPVRANMQRKGGDGTERKAAKTQGRQDSNSPLAPSRLGDFALNPEIAALFPDSFEDSPLGKIPKGWTAAKLADVISVFDSRRIPLSGREREKRRGIYPYYGAASVMDYVDDYLFDGVYVLMGEDGSVINEDGTPVLQYVWDKFWVNNHAHVLQGSNGVSTEHLLLHLKECNIVPYVTGAVQPKLNQGNMNRIDFMLPNAPVSHAFAQSIAPLFAQFRFNREQSISLALARDVLLPRLLSGEIRVPEAEQLIDKTTTNSQMEAAHG